MSAMVGPIICLLSLVLIPSDYAARSQPFPNHYEQDSGRKQPSPNLDDILLRLKLNLDQYLTTLPSFFCNEHVVSQLSHQLSVKTAKRNVTNSIFRIKRTLSEDATAALVESRGVQRINGKPTKDEDVRGPSILSGACTGSLAFVLYRSEHLRTIRPASHRRRPTVQSKPRRLQGTELVRCSQSISLTSATKWEAYLL